MTENESERRAYYLSQIERLEAIGRDTSQPKERRELAYKQRAAVQASTFFYQDRTVAKFYLDDLLADGYDCISSHGRWIRLSRSTDGNALIILHDKREKDYIEAMLRPA